MTFWTNGTCWPTPKPSFVVGPIQFSLCIENPKYGAYGELRLTPGWIGTSVRSNENLIVESYIIQTIRP
jgi:hypothetical protein